MTLREDIIEVLSRRSPAYLSEIHKDLERMTGIIRSRQCIYMNLQKHSRSLEMKNAISKQPNALPEAFRRIEDPNGGNRHAWALISRDVQIVDIVPLMIDILHQSKYALPASMIVKRLQKKLDRQPARYDACVKTVNRLLSENKDIFQPHGKVNHYGYSLIGEEKTMRKKVISRSLTWYVKRAIGSFDKLLVFDVFDLARVVINLGYKTGSRNPAQCIASSLAREARAGRNYVKVGYGLYSLMGV